MIVIFSPQTYTKLDVTGEPVGGILGRINFLDLLGSFCMMLKAS